MKTYGRYIVFGLMACLACSCNKPETASPEATAEVKKAQKAPTQSPEEAAKLAERNKKLQAQTEKLRNEGHLIAPRVDINFNVVGTNEKISFDDAHRSWEFKKNAITRCYHEVLLFNMEAKGDVSVKLARGTDANIQISEYKTSFTDPDFDDCMHRAFRAWRLPENAEISAQLTFASRPAPTADEIRQMFGSPDHHEHDHAPKAEQAEPKAELAEPKAELAEPKAELAEPKAEQAEHQH